MTALAVVVMWAAYFVRDVLLLLYISGLLAIGFSPIVRLIERQKLTPHRHHAIPRWLAILILYLAILGSIALVITLVFPPLSDQAQQLVERPLRDVRACAAIPDLKGHPQRASDAAAGGGTRRAAVPAVRSAPSAVAGVLGGIFGLVTVLILTFYLLVDSGSLHRFLIQLFPRRDRARVDAAARTITMKVSAWLGGQLVLAAIIGSTSALGLWLLGIPFFYVLALISAIGEMIPIVGPVLAAIPAIAVAGTVSLKKVLFVIVFFIVQQQIENHLLVPKVMERRSASALLPSSSRSSSAAS